MSDNTKQPLRISTYISKRIIGLFRKLGCIQGIIVPEDGRVSASKRRVQENRFVGRSSTLLLNKKPGRMSVKTSTCYLLKRQLSTVSYFGRLLSGMPYLRSARKLNL